MRTIGIRAGTKDVTFAVYDSDANAIINVETLKIPKALNRPGALKYVRNCILDVLRLYAVERAGLRVTESTAQNPAVERIELEGVIKESFASSVLAAYYCGQISSIAARLNIDRTRFKPLVDGTEDYELVDNWGELSREGREAVLTALGARNA